MACGGEDALYKPLHPISFAFACAPWHSYNRTSGERLTWEESVHGGQAEDQLDAFARVA
jgi:hypothetical protein